MPERNVSRPRSVPNDDDGVYDLLCCRETKARKGDGEYSRLSEYGWLLITNGENPTRRVQERNSALVCIKPKPSEHTHKQKEQRNRKEEGELHGHIRWRFRQRSRTGWICSMTGPPRSWPRAGFSDNLSVQGSGLRARQTWSVLRTVKSRKRSPTWQRGKPKGTLEGEIHSAISLLGQRPPRYTGVGRS